jgi:hypothetical protein
MNHQTPNLKIQHLNINILTNTQLLNTIYPTTQSGLFFKTNRNFVKPKEPLI